MINPGALVYIERCKRRPYRNEPQIQFKNGSLGFAMLLGHMQPGMEQPSPEHLMCMLGKLGFVSWDVIIEALGKELADKALKVWSDKYVPKATVPEILDKDGQPIIVK